MPIKTYNYLTPEELTSLINKHRNSGSHSRTNLTNIEINKLFSYIEGLESFLDEEGVHWDYKWRNYLGNE